MVTPRITLTTPPRLSRGVTPPNTSRSTSLSSSRVDSPLSPDSSAPPRGTAGSLSPAMAPATAAASVSPEADFPSPSTAPGATNTTRSWFSSLALAISSVTLSPAAPAATHSRSRRRSEASITLERISFCTARSALPQMTAATFSTPASRAKAS